MYFILSSDRKKSTRLRRVWKLKIPSQCQLCSRLKVFDTQGKCFYLPNSFYGDFTISPGSWGVSYCGNKHSFLKSRCQPSCRVEIASPRNLRVWSLRDIGGKWRRSMPTKIPDQSRVYTNSSHNSLPASLFWEHFNSSTNYSFQQTWQSNLNSEPIHLQFHKNTILQYLGNFLQLLIASLLL